MGQSDSATWAHNAVGPVSHEHSKRQVAQVAYSKGMLRTWPSLIGERVRARGRTKEMT